MQRPWKEMNPGRRARPIVLVRLGAQICQMISSTVLLVNNLLTRRRDTFMERIERAYFFFIFYK